MEKIKEWIRKVKELFRNILDAIKNIKSEIDFYKNLWEKPQGKKSVEHLWREVCYLLKKAEPTKIEGKILFGTGDPAITGQALGVLGAVYGFLPEGLIITPDFENEVYEGNIDVKGRIRLIHLVIVAVRLLLDRDFRYVVKKVLAKEGEEHEQQ